MSRIKQVWLFAHNIIRSARRLVNDELRPLGLSSAEGNIILHLFTRDDVPRQDDIVEELDISRPAVSRALDSLEAKGYVARERDATDRRVSRVILTDRAREIGPLVESIYDRVFTLAARGLTGEQVDAAVAFFAQVSESFSEARRSTRDRL